MNKLFCLGECLIDFIPDSAGALKNVQSFIKKAGGAPANVAAANCKLGGESYFIGKFAHDGFAEFLLDVLRQHNIKLDYVQRTSEANTALAFVSHSDNGERDFSFYRSPSADMLLSCDEIQPWFNAGDILHSCSLSLIEAPIKYAYIKAAEHCFLAGGLNSFDLNIRLPLWKSQDECVNAILDFIKFASLIKASVDELEMVTNINDEKKAVAALFEIAQSAKMIIVTDGANGSTAYDKNGNSVSVKALKVKPIDTTGAGDCYMGAILHQLLNQKTLPSIDKMESILKFASAAAAVSVTKKGAIDAMPSLLEVTKLL